MRLGLAAECEIRARCRFARKHYFYPDLPKGFQISQFDEPLVRGRTRRVRARRRAAPRAPHPHPHGGGRGQEHARAGRALSLVDYNRAGVPLSRSSASPTCARPTRRPSTCAPSASWCAASASPTATWRRARSAATPTSACARAGETKLGTKTEIKNMNSFKHVEAAIEYEVARQADAPRARRARGAGDAPVERRQGHVARDALEGAGARLPLLPRAGPAAAASSTRRGSRACAASCPSCRCALAALRQSLGLSAYDAGVLDRRARDGRLLRRGRARCGAAGEAGGQLDHGQASRRARSRRFVAELIALIDDGTISGKIGKDVFEA